MSTKILCLLIIIMACSACSNENDGEPIDTGFPTIEIIEPKSNDIYAPQDTVFIKASLSDNVSLRKGSVHIHDQFLPANADTVFVFQFSSAEKHYAIDTFWIVNDARDKSYKIYIEGVDKAENFTQKFLYFHQFH